MKEFIQDFDSKSELDELSDYRRDETREHGKSLFLLGLAVLLVSFFRLPIAEISLFGVQIGQAPDVMLRAMALTSLLYWLAFYSLCTHADSIIRQEQNRPHIENIGKAYFLDADREIREEKKMDLDDPFLKYQHMRAKQVLEEMEKQNERLRPAKPAIKFLRALQILVPYCTGVPAIVLIVWSFI